MPPPYHRRAGFLTLAAAALAVLSLFPAYDGNGSLAGSLSGLTYVIGLAAVLAAVGVCLLAGSWRVGTFLLVGVTGSVFGVHAAAVARAVSGDGHLGAGWWLDKAAFAFLLGATVIAVIGLTRRGGVGFGLSMSAGVVLAAGFFLTVVYTVGEIIPFGEVTARNGDMVMRFNWGALLDGDDTIGRLGHLLGIALTGWVLIIACLARPLRAGVATLGGWAMAEAAGLVGDAVKLLRPQTIAGARFTGVIGPGFTVRCATLVLIAGLVAAAMLVERRRTATVPLPAPEAAIAA
jgi:hypothetical protein